MPSIWPGWCPPEPVISRREEVLQVRINRLFVRVLLIGTTCISVACSAAPTPVAVAPTAAPAPPTVAVAPTPTFERVREAEPTVGAPAKPTAAPPVPTVAAAQPHGVLAWRDDTLRNDGVLVSLEDLPTSPSDSDYATWLIGSDRSVFLGILTDGTLSFAAADHGNLLADFDTVAVARIAKSVSAPSSPPSNATVAVGKLPPQALVHIRHVLVRFEGTPDQLGFALGMRQEADKVLLHAQFLQDAVDESNLPNVLFHAEHLVNMIEGKEGEHYGDLNGNGKVENPGDGYGLLENGSQLGYVKGMQDHAVLAFNSPDATDGIKLHAAHVQITGGNTRGRLVDIRDRALEVSKVRRAADARENAQRILALAHQMIDGVDLNGDEQISPVPGEGGVLTAYQHAQLMAGISLSSPVAVGATLAPSVVSTAAATLVAPTVVSTAAATLVAPTVVSTAAATLVPTVAPTVAPTVLPTAAPTAAARPAASRIELTIADDTFTPRTLSVPVGATVVWSRSGGVHPHTVTADDGSFDSGILRGPQGFEHPFNAAGTFAYYCDVHGGPGGVGMSGTITVTP
jgi:plastocyanin